MSDQNPETGINPPSGPVDPFHDWRSTPTMDGTRRKPDIFPGIKAPPVRVNVTKINQVKLKGKGQRGNTLTHRAFYAVPLCLDIGMQAAANAQELFAGIDFHVTKTATGIDRDVKHSSHDDFMAYLQQSLIALTFSFQAIETYANAIIGNALPHGQFYESEKRGKPVKYTGACVQRTFTTERKLSEVLPRLTGLAPVHKQDNKLWEDFTKLQKLRDEAIHLKWELQERSLQPGIQVDDHTLWHMIINSPIDRQPTVAARFIHHFSLQLDPVPPWLWHVIDKFKISDSRPRPVNSPGTITIKTQRR